MIKVFSLPNTIHIAKDLGIVSSYKIKKYRFGEFSIILEQDIKEQDRVIVVGNIFASSMLELISLLDALFRAGAKDIILALPYIAFSRQDKMENPYSSVELEIIIKILNLFDLSKVIIFDIHNSAKLALFSSKVDNIDTGEIFKNEVDKYIKSHENTLIIAPDFGSYKRIRNIYPEAIYLNKNRIMGKVKFTNKNSFRNQNILLLDDILDSGKTIRGALDFLYKSGASSIYGFITHILGDDYPNEIILSTDSIFCRSDLRLLKISHFIKELVF